MAKEYSWNRTIETIEDEGEYKGKRYFEKFYKETKDTWFKEVKEERGFISFMNRLRANHYNLNESLARKHIIESPPNQHKTFSGPS